MYCLQVFRFYDDRAEEVFSYDSDLKTLHDILFQNRFVWSKDCYELNIDYFEVNSEYEEFKEEYSCVCSR